MAQLVPLAKIIAMTSSGIATGAIWCVSYFAVPVILQIPPEAMAKSWQTAYDIGASTMPPLSIAIAGSFAFLASQSTKLPGRFPDLALDPTTPFALYTGAAVFITAVGPYTLAIMKPTNDKLHKKVAEPKSMTESEMKDTIRKWRGLNYNRGLIALAGTLMGAFAICAT